MDLMVGVSCGIVGVASFGVTYRVLGYGFLVWVRHISQSWRKVTALLSESRYTLYVGMTWTCLCRHTYEKLTTAPTLHLLAFLGG